jgi:hypothetical protein
VARPLSRPSTSHGRRAHLSASVRPRSQPRRWDTSAATLLAAAQKAQPDVEHAADLAANAAAKNSDWDTLSREESYMVHAGQVMGLI